MHKRVKENRLMPNRDPNNWQWLISMIPYLLLSAATFTVGFITVLHNGGPWRKALMSATVGTILSLSLYPGFLWVTDYYGLPDHFAFAACVFISIMGLEWIRAKADGLYEVLLGFLKKWLK